MHFRPLVSAQQIVRGNLRMSARHDHNDANEGLDAENCDGEGQSAAKRGERAAHYYGSEHIITVATVWSTVPKMGNVRIRYHPSMALTHPGSTLNTEPLNQWNTAAMVHAMPIPRNTLTALEPVLVRGQFWHICPKKCRHLPRCRWSCRRTYPAPRTLC